MTKYSVIASALYGNKGAASMLEASLQLLDDGESTFTLLSVYPEQDQRRNRHPELAIVDARPFRLALVTNPLAILHRLLPPIRGLICRLDPAVACLAQADVLLDQGGITFSDGREKFLPFNVATVLPALILGVPVVKCAQAMGPFEGRLNRALAKVILPRMAAIIARGEHTAVMVEDLGIPVERGVDLAFALEVDMRGVDALLERLGLARPSGGRIGVCPSEVARRSVASLEGQDETSYETSLAAVIDRIAADGLEVVLIPHSLRPETDAPHNNDLPLCRRIEALTAPETAVHVVDAELHADELRLVISTCDVLVTSRFHGMISALAVGVPPLVLGWGHKYREVLELFGMLDAGLDAAELVDPSVVERVMDVFESADVRRELIAKNLPGVVRQARAHAATIAAVVRRADPQIRS